MPPASEILELQLDLTCRSDAYFRPRRSRPHTKANSRTLGVRQRRIKHGSSAVESISISSFPLVTMRSIIVCTFGVAIAGLIHSQHRWLVSNYNLGKSLDLAITGMGTEKATAFINTICSHPMPLPIGYFPIPDPTAAINVETNEVMTMDDYRNGPGARGNSKYNYAIYPWSIVKGGCSSVLNSSWVTDRVVATGPAVKNTNWGDRWEWASINMEIPNPNVTTTLSWLDPMPMARKISAAEEFFRYSDRRAVYPLIHSMNWQRELPPVIDDVNLEVPACTQAWLAAPTVERTIVAYYMLDVEHYYWCFESRVLGLKISSRGGHSETWMDVTKDNRGKGRVFSTGFNKVYSSGGYVVRVDSLAKQTPVTAARQPPRFTTVQVQRLSLHHSECHG
jgi:hypothetical protein